MTFTQHEVGGYKCEDLNFCDDILGFEAILNLHRQLDDDANGDIDISESKEVCLCFLCLCRTQTNHGFFVQTVSS